MNELRDSPVAQRVLTAGVVGGGLAIAAAVTAMVVAAALPCDAEGWGCLGGVLLVIGGCLAGAALLSWPLLWLLRVRPALPVAALGTAVSVLAGWSIGQARLQLDILSPDLSMFVLVSVGFAVAALACGRGTPPPWRIGALLAVLALLPTAYFAAGHQERQTLAARDRHLASSGFPLLAPDLPGYVVQDASASERAFRYTLLPAGRASAGPRADDYTVASSSISVGVHRLPARFAPPERCNWDDAYEPDQPCTAAGPNLWRRSEGPRNIVYLVRKGAVLVTVSQGGDTIDEKRLRRIARTLAPRPASHFRASG